MITPIMQLLRAIRYIVYEIYEEGYCRIFYLPVCEDKMIIEVAVSPVFYLLLITLGWS